jgi:hypothetical protein
MNAPLGPHRPGSLSVSSVVKNGRIMRALVLGLALVVFFAASVSAQQAKHTPRPLKKAAKKTGKQAAPPPMKLTIEPRAVELLKAACDRMAAARTMSFTAVVTYESPSRLGPPLAYTTQSEMTMQRPDKLRVITSGDGPASEFYYNGKTMTAFAPVENLVAVAEAPPTIDAALKIAFDSAAIYFPFTDLVVADPYKDLADGMILAFCIGQSRVVGGITTDMVAYANKDVFVQIWIGVEDKLPRMLRAVYAADPAQLRHQMELSDWKLDVDVPADAFASAKAASAMPMAFAHPGSRPPPPMGIKSPPKGKKKKGK